MTILRFDYQTDAAMSVPGKVVEIGCNNDPANLKAKFGDRITQCDRYQWDDALNYPIHADSYFNAGGDEWPFGDDEFDLCIMGDVFEHLYRPEGLHALKEANRVARKLVITVPEDHRVEQGKVLAAGSFHVVVCDEKYMRDILEESGWNPTDWQIVDYVCIPIGRFITAERISTREEE